VLGLGWDKMRERGQRKLDNLSRLLKKKKIVSGKGK
jgi:hypothetical protein